MQTVGALQRRILTTGFDCILVQAADDLARSFFLGPILTAQMPQRAGRPAPKLRRSVILSEELSHNPLLTKTYSNSNAAGFNDSSKRGTQAQSIAGEEGTLSR